MYQNESEIRYVTSLLGLIRKDLMAQSLSVAVITPYKAQVRRLKQALQPLHDLSVEEDKRKDKNLCREGGRLKEKERDKDRDRKVEKEKEKESNKMKNEKYSRHEENEKKKYATKVIQKKEKEDGEEDEIQEMSVEVEKEVEKEDVKSFDCEVNSIDGFQVNQFLFHLIFFNLSSIFFSIYLIFLIILK